MGSSRLAVCQNTLVFNVAALNQVKFMKRIAEMSDLTQVIRTLPRIKKHLFNPENMRWAQSCEGLCAACVSHSRARLFQVCPQRRSGENV